MTMPSSTGTLWRAPPGPAGVTWQRERTVATLRHLRALRGLDRLLIRLPLHAATTISKFGIPGLGALGLTFAIPLIYVAVLCGSLSGRLRVHPRRFQLFVLMAAVLWLMQLFMAEGFSAPSLLMLCALHLPYVFSMRSGCDRTLLAWVAFRRISTVLACLGIAQYLLQFAIGSTLAYPIDNLLPSSMKVAGFNSQGWIEYGSATLRSNGVFMLEPSFFSQVLAIAIIGELVYGDTGWWRIALHLTGIVVSYSGTGLLSLAACVPVWVVMERRWKWAAAAGVGALLFAALIASGVAADNPFMKIFLQRSLEFTSPGSSGFARFVGGYYMFDQYLWPDAVRALFGVGAGTFLPYSLTAHYPAHGMALFKMVFEFGIVGAAFYFAFIVYCFASSAAPLLLRVAIFVPLMIQNYVPFAHGLALSLLIWNAPRHPFVLRGGR
ncbi:hypothetical protein [Aquincola sp. J276]|uniref:hypothetical protein n=1 Tax=Aquincola sp. J276 TaxID=2898432 RepID=UPI0021514447|nr:hypothetical protein [Aquincola sp. J276]MCR5868796.1 hypothetical protein [Aquincola sp. J276]